MLLTVNCNGTIYSSLTVITYDCCCMASGVGQQGDVRVCVLMSSEWFEPWKVSYN